jgi:hypothetical protein
MQCTSFPIPVPRRVCTPKGGAGPWLQIKDHQPSNSAESVARGGSRSQPLHSPPLPSKSLTSWKGITSPSISQTRLLASQSVFGDSDTTSCLVNQLLVVVWLSID